MKSLTNRFLIPTQFLDVLVLLNALWIGLKRFEWQLLALAHGPIMICGFLGTLVTLERAVAMKQKWI